MTYGEFTALFSDVRKEWAYVADINTYEMLFMTKTAMEATGIKDEKEYLGKKCYEIFQNAEEPCAFCTNKYLLEGKSPYVWERYNKIMKKWMRLENYLFDIDGRKCRGELALDISKDHDAIALLQDQLELEKVLTKSIRTLAMEPNVHNAVNTFLQYIGNYYKSDRVCIFEIDYIGNTVSNTYEWCKEGVKSEMALYQGAPLGVISDWLENVKNLSSQTVTPEKSENKKDIDEVLKKRGVKNLLVVPFYRKDVLVGFLGVDNPG
ncbi:MAG: hypothetical protein IJC39_03260, partial [Firmicutes bacterium]|nr:hypothetical protein [Bacillota bacterium]